MRGYVAGGDMVGVIRLLIFIGATGYTESLMMICTDQLSPPKGALRSPKLAERVPP